MGLRRRLVTKLVSLAVLLVLSVVLARSCGPFSPSSPLDPLQLTHSGIAGVCADEQAVNAADGGGSAPLTVASPGLLAQLQASDPGGLAAIRQAGGSLTCPPTTDRVSP
jgi:hypothetical protein